jgi:hypothetical protein
MEMQTRLLFHLHFASGSPTDLLYRVVYGQGSDALLVLDINVCEIGCASRLSVRGVGKIQI